MPPICRHPPDYHRRDLDLHSPDFDDRSQERYVNRFDLVEPVETPDPSNYTVEDAAQVGKNLVLKIKYPNCSACSYEGQKILVYLDTSTLQALKWRKIDPHFKDPSIKITSDQAPSPAARFPASAIGWQDALDYAGRDRRS